MKTWRSSIPGGPTADKGGDLGQPYKRGMLPGLEDKVFPLQTGEFTAPIRTRQGFVILKVTEHQAGGVPPLKDVVDQIDDAMFTQMMEPALRKYMTSLREKASIDIAAGFVDTGASPNEIKLVQSSATPLPVKKERGEEAKVDSSGCGKADRWGSCVAACLWCRRYGGGGGGRRVVRVLRLAVRMLLRAFESYRGG